MELLTYYKTALQQAENIIKTQLGEAHEGRGTWLMNYGESVESQALRSKFVQEHPNAYSEFVRDRVKRPKTVFYNGTTGYAITDLNAYQERANGFINEARYTEQADYLLNTALGLTGEGGEFADIVKKIRFHGHEMTEELEIKLAYELGDVLWYVAQGAKALRTTLSDIASLNIEKLTKRHKGETFSEEQSKAKEAAKPFGNEFSQRMAELNEEHKRQSVCEHKDWFFGMNGVKTCMFCKKPLFEPIESAVQKTFEEKEEANNEKAKALVERERTRDINLIERHKQRLKAYEVFKTKTLHYKERRNGIVEKGDLLWVAEYQKNVDGKKVTEGGYFKDAEKLYALNHPVDYFIMVIAPREYTTSEPETQNVYPFLKVTETNYDNEFERAIQMIPDGWVLVPSESHGETYLEGDEMLWSEATSRFEKVIAGFYPNKYKVRSFIAVIKEQSKLT